MPLTARGKGSELRIAEEAATNVALGDPLDQSVNGRIVPSEGWRAVWSPARNDQIGLRIELVSPKPRDPERLILQILAKVMMEAT